MKNRKHGTRFTLNDLLNNIGGNFTGSGYPVTMNINTNNPLNSLSSPDQSKLENSANNFLNDKADAASTAKSIGDTLKNAGINSREGVTAILKSLNITGEKQELLLEELDKQRQAPETLIKDEFSPNTQNEIKGSSSNPNQAWQTIAAALSNLSQLFPKATAEEQENLSTLVENYKNDKEGSTKKLATSLGEYFKNNNISSAEEVQNTVSKLGLSEVKQKELITELNNQREQANPESK